MFILFCRIHYKLSVCDRIENSDQTGTGPDLNHFDRNRTGTGPEPDRITSQKMLTGFDGFFTGFLNFNTQLTSHKHKYSSFNFEIWVDWEGQDMSRHFYVGLWSVCTMLPCEASEQKLGQKPKSTPKEIKLWTCHHSICLEKNKQLKKIISKSDKWPSHPNYKVAL